MCKILASIISLVFLFGFATTGYSAEEATISNSSVELLEAQIEVITSYQNTFVSIVLWALGAVLAMALGLAAFNWYSNKINYERDLKSLRQENESLIRLLEANLRKELESNKNSLEESIASREDSITKSVEEKFKDKFSSQSSQLDSLRIAITDLEYVSTEREAEDAVKQKRHAWAIYLYLDLLLISVKQNSYQYQAGEILDEISKILDIDGVSVPSDYVTKATSTFKKLPNGYRTTAENLLPKFNKAAHGL